ncbi:MAG TPA: glycosyl hydrolase family 79 C-terminal domain-containing protein, partial [Solirubrobacteraceae bacterium]|nr:glycosyl hydrolase family 79 C-terminal domain-containing protein [Solirubrobacteraceae bacterium]
PHGTLRFVLVDDDPPSSRAVTLSLHVGGGYSGANVLRLTAPSPQALSGVRLGGAAVAADGSWLEPSRLPQLPIRSGVIALTMAPSSAALVTVSPRSQPAISSTHS